MIIIVNFPFKIFPICLFYWKSILIKNIFTKFSSKNLRCAPQFLNRTKIYFEYNYSPNRSDDRFPNPSSHTMSPQTPHLTISNTATNLEQRNTSRAPRWSICYGTEQNVKMLAEIHQKIQSKFPEKIHNFRKYQLLISQVSSTIDEPETIKLSKRCGKNFFL